MSESMTINNLPHLRDQGHITIYSNFAQVTNTPWDIRIDFSRFGELEPGQLGIKDLVAVIMTPALAKALLNVLSDTLKRYEEENGEITMPKSFVSAVQEQGARSSSDAKPSDVPVG
jgi:hypothetical protein